MKTGVVAVALAASTLLAAPASAQDGRRGDRGFTSAEFRGGPVNVRGDRGFRGNARHVNGRRGYGPGLNEYGQTPREVQYLIDKAIYECSCQLEVDARKYGFRDGEFRRPRVEQIGPSGFRVVGRAKLFDGYDYTRQPYDCVVRRGQVRRASNLYPVRYRSFHSTRNRGAYNNSGFSISFGSRW